MKLEYKHDIFIPKQFAMGIDRDGNGFPSMKAADGKWTNLSVFEKHCGFKPYTQRDASKEISKDMYQVVQNVENVPTSGFKLVNVRHCVYKSDHFRDVECATLKDPRGWQFSIELEVLQELLQRNGFNIKDQVLENLELVYTWPARGQVFSVAAVDDKIHKLQAASDAYMQSFEHAKVLKPSEFEIGKVYSSTTSKLAGFKYMYLGVHDVFSEDMQLYAVEHRDYGGLSKFKSDWADMTSSGRHVLYCLDGDRNASYLRYNNPGTSPYYIASSMSKLFDTVEDIDPASFMMHNDCAKPCTLENIRDDMAKSLYFNMIDFTKPAEKTAVDFSVLKDLYSASADDSRRMPPFREMLVFPMSAHCLDSVCFETERARTVNIKKWCRSYDDGHLAYEIREARKRKDYDWYSSTKSFATYGFDNTPESSEAALKRLYEDYKPAIITYFLQNGNAVEAHQNVVLNQQYA